MTAWTWAATHTLEKSSRKLRISTWMPSLSSTKVASDCRLVGQLRLGGCRSGVDYVDTEQILLGLLRDKRALASVALEEAGVSTEEIREEINRRFVPGAGRRTNGALTTLAAKSLQLSLRESRRFGHNYLGTEHVLLGLLKLKDGLAYDVLVEAGTTPEVVKRTLLRMLHGRRFRFRAGAGG